MLYQKFWTISIGQIPVVTFDLPLFALAKQIQWTWPESYGEDKLVVMFGASNWDGSSKDDWRLAAR